MHGPNRTRFEDENEFDLLVALFDLGRGRNPHEGVFRCGCQLKTPDAAEWLIRVECYDAGWPGHFQGCFLDI